MKYVVMDLNDHELGRANDARFTWQLIEEEWPDASVQILGGPWFRGWMQLAVHLPSGGALIIYAQRHK